MSLPVSYTTVSKMMLTFPAIGSVTTLDSGAMAHHAGMAEAFINAKIAKLYSLPFTSSIPLLETLATDLGIYNILSTRITLKTDTGQHPWYQRFKSALAIVDEIAWGKIPLADSSGAVVSGRGDQAEVYSNTMNYKPTTAEIPITVQQVDPDKVEDELNNRDLGGFTDQLL